MPTEVTLSLWELFWIIAFAVILAVTDGPSWERLGMAAVSKRWGVRAEKPINNPDANERTKER